ncbi:hypothetical protein [Catellatospora tritici]|uniref:hypothetical protein n=1 Tax=Catellatospora tritici TaxID=2851566 RepID=UPI001C2D57CE|nr:hypothetical protein [Catellatospora tritici]MBV1856124.1 hypothetical protein [Catellatospora tritici]
MTTTARSNRKILPVARAALVSLGLATVLAPGATFPQSSRVTEAGLTTELRTASQATLTTTAPSNLPVGSALKDRATLAGGVENPTGTITFRLFFAEDEMCSFQLFTSTVEVDGNGTYDSGTYTPTGIGYFQWTAEYSGDDHNEPVSTSCNDIHETTSVVPVQPTLSTVASDDIVLGGSIHDTATLSGAYMPYGSIEFYLFGPADPDCHGPAVFSSVKSLTGENGSFDSASFTPTVAGTYRWVADTLPDENNLPVHTGCHDPGEDVVVSTRGVSLTTAASPNVALGGKISDVATLAGGAQPTGTITFHLYGPNDATCAKAAVFTASATVDGNAAYPSGEFQPTKAGTYRWTAAYSGDVDNEPVASLCNALGERVIVSPVTTPKLVTDASGNTQVGSRVYDRATLSGAVNPTGTIKFSLYGPNDSTCTTKPVFTSTVQVKGNSGYRSTDFRPAKAGTYRWRASYSGDTRNAGVTTRCDDSAERVIVRPKP